METRRNSILRNESGLTTLEWLLIVAAVAGLAALAVVLVQNVVDETAEEITGSNARETAAQVAAAKITSDARSDLPPDGAPADWDATNWKLRESEQQAVQNEYSAKCNRLGITYSDVELKVKWSDVKPVAAPAAAAGARGSRSDKAGTDNMAWSAQDEVLCKLG